MKRETKINFSQNLTGSLTHFKVLTPASLVVSAAEGSDAYFEQHSVIEKVVGVVAMRARPVIMSDIIAEGFTIAVEKKDAIDVAEIQAEIQAMGTVDFGGATVDLSAVTLEEAPYQLVVPVAAP